MEDAWLAGIMAKLRAKGCATKIILADDETGQGGEAFLKEDSPNFLPLPGSTP